MKELKAGIMINASPEKVWQVLIDFERYPEWNPFIKSIEGKPVEGSKIVAKMEPAGGNAMTFKPVLLRVKPNEHLLWLGHLFIPGIFDGEHSFLIEGKGEGKCFFTQSEKFKGVLVPLFKKCWTKMSGKDLK